MSCFQPCSVGVQGGESRQGIGLHEHRLDGEEQQAGFPKAWGTPCIPELGMHTACEIRHMDLRRKTGIVDKFVLIHAELR